jgi:hypothetical protein
VRFFCGRAAQVTKCDQEILFRRRKLCGLLFYYEQYSENEAVFYYMQLVFHAITITLLLLLYIKVLQLAVTTKGHVILKKIETVRFFCSGHCFFFLFKKQENCYRTPVPSKGCRPPLVAEKREGRVNVSKN